MVCQIMEMLQRPEETVRQQAKRPRLEEDEAENEDRTSLELEKEESEKENAAAITENDTHELSHLIKEITPVARNAKLSSILSGIMPPRMIMRLQGDPLNVETLGQFVACPASDVIRHCHGIVSAQMIVSLQQEAAVVLMRSDSMNECGI